jgi:cyclase
MPHSNEIPAWETELREIAPNVYAYFQAKGSWFRSNAGLIVGSEYAVVVDSLATVGLTQNFINEIKKVTDKPVRFLVNTHHHGDHLWGNHLFEEATVICHNKCREQVLSTQMYDPAILNAYYPDFDFQGIQITPPDITFDEDLTMHIDGREIRLIHFKPAHTPGDILIYLPQERVIFAGDLLFLYSTPVGFEASFQGWIETLDNMSELDATIYVPGHGPLCGNKGVHECREYLALIEKEGLQRFNDGMSASDAARDINLGRFRKWANWERIVINMDRLYREFRGEEPNSPIDRVALFEQVQQLLDSELDDNASAQHGK